MAHEDALVDGSVSEMEKRGEEGEQRRGKREGGRGREKRDDSSIIFLVTERKDILQHKELYANIQHCQKIEMNAR